MLPRVWQDLILDCLTPESMEVSKAEAFYATSAFAAITCSHIPTIARILLERWKEPVRRGWNSLR